MPYFESSVEFSELLFNFDYNHIIKQVDLFSTTPDQIEYLLFVIREANRVINIFNLYEDCVIDKGEIFYIKPVLEIGFLSVLNKYADKKLKVIKSSYDKEHLKLIFDIESEYYKYIDRVKACITLIQTEINYRQNLEITRQSKPVYPVHQEELFAVKERDLHPKIKWLRTEEQLFKLFSLLNTNRFIETYEKPEILVHFVIYNSKNRITLFCKSDKKFQWFGSDNEFCFLLNQLVKKKIIPEHKKYKIVGSHFINREGGEFIYLAQKHNFSKNYLQTKPLLIKIVDEVDSFDFP